MKTKNKIQSSLDYLYVLMGVAILVFGVSQFYTGQHNIDLSWNFQHLGLSDTASDGNYYTMSDIYQVGMNQINWGFVLAICGVFIATCCLVDMYNMVGRKDL